jgi:hypothetical protein
MLQARVLADSKNVAVLETLSRKCKTHVEQLTRENKKTGHVSLRVIFISAKKHKKLLIKMLKENKLAEKAVQLTFHHKIHRPPTIRCWYSPTWLVPVGVRDYRNDLDKDSWSTSVKFKAFFGYPEDSMSKICHSQMIFSADLTHKLRISYKLFSSFHCFFY